MKREKEYPNFLSYIFSYDMHMILKQLFYSEMETMFVIFAPNIHR